MTNWLYRRVDNTALIVFRWCLGLLITLEAFGAIATGWVHANFIAPEYTFPFIAFDWLRPLPGWGMYAYFGLMGVFGILVTLGYRYRLSIVAYFLMWAGAYFMQKTSYNNHYYLLLLILGFMAVMPAHRYASLDARRNPSIKAFDMPNWCRWLFLAQMLIVYTYASVAKWHAEWIDLTVIELLLAPKAHYWGIGAMLQSPVLHAVVAYGGILFDLLVIPLLLWRPTQKWTFVVAIGFHLFNAVVFQIGIFPFLALALSIFCFDPEAMRRLWLPNKPKGDSGMVIRPANHRVVSGVLLLYMLIQLLLPLRHWTIPGDVLWTEEGHRLSWRMMFRVKRGVARITVKDLKTGDTEVVDQTPYLTPKQQQLVATRPDFAWQFAQYLKQKYADRDRDIAVYIDSKVRINKRPYYPFLDAETDLANTDWQPLSHSTWILPSKP